MTPIVIIFAVLSALWESLDSESVLVLYKDFRLQLSDEIALRMLKGLSKNALSEHSKTFVSQVD